MTIRDYIKRRVRWGYGIGFVSWLFIAITGNMGFFGTKTGFAAIIPFIGVFGFSYAILSIMFIRCPKCRTRIGQSIAMYAAFRLYGPQVKYCPFCAVNLDDEQMPP